MTYELYAAELKKRLADPDWRQKPKAADSPASQLMKHAARDKELSLDEYAELSNTYLGWRAL